MSSRNRRRTSRGPIHRRLVLEQLESRQLLSASRPEFGLLDASYGRFCLPLEAGFALPANALNGWGEGEGALVQDPRIDMSIVRQPTATNDDGKVANLPESADWVHEWETFWVELWVSAPEATEAIAGATVDLYYDSSYLTAQQIVFGSAFPLEQTGTIDDALGQVGGLGGRTELDHVGGDGYALLARVWFASTDDDQVPADPVGRKIGPYDMQMALANGQTELVGGERLMPDLGGTPGTELWAVVYDAADSNRIDFGDLSFMASAFGYTVGDPASEPPFAWWGDFDKSGKVDFGDVSFFAVNFGKTRSTVESGSETITFPPNFPDAYRALNAAPVSEDDSYSTRIDTPLTIAAPGVLANDTDADGDSLTAGSLSDPSHGTLDLNPDGSFTYTPAAGFAGTDSFTYRAIDGTDESNPATVTIRVNRPPVADDQSVATDENTPAPITLTANDPDGDPLTYTIVGQPAHGLLTGTAPELTYTPNTDYTGEDTITFQADDGMLTSLIATVAITINAVNAAPVAADDSYSTPVDEPLTVAAPGVLANDADAEGDPLTAVLVSGPKHGTLVLNANGSFTYTPAAGFTGSDSFQYRANDGELDSTIATGTIRVRASEEGLVAHWTLDDGQGITAADSTKHGNPLTLVPSGSEPNWVPSRRGGALLFNGTSSYAQATNVPVNQSPGGKNTVAFWMNWNGGGNQVPINLGSYALWIVGHRLGFNTANGDDLSMTTFTASNCANKWIHVVAVFVNADTSLPDWRTKWAAESKLYINGVAQALTQTGTPIARTVSSTVRIGPGGAGTLYFGGLLDDVRIYSRELSAAEVVGLYYPFAVDDTFLRSPDQPFTAAAPGVLANDTGTEGKTLSPILVTSPEHGEVTLNADGSFTYTPDEDWYWHDSFTYKVNDGISDSDVAVVSIVSDVPAVSDKTTYNTHVNTLVTYGVSGGVLEAATGMEGTTLTAHLESDVSHGSLTLNTDGSFVYEPDENFTGSDSFTFRAFDGTYYSFPVTATVTVTEKPKPISGLSSWENLVFVGGAYHSERILDGRHGWGTHFYDATRVFQNIADYTGEPDKWLPTADKIGDLWLDNYVWPNNGAIASWENVTHGLTERYFRTGDDTIKEAVIAISRNASFAGDWYPEEPEDYQGEILHYSCSREAAHVLNSYINAERLGEPRRARLDWLFEVTLDHMDQWIATKDNPYDDIYWSPFMIALSAEALIHYWNHIEQDPRILEKIGLLGDAMWEVAWQEKYQTFIYRVGQVPQLSDAPDLNLLIAPVYSWLYLQTGDAAYRDRGDKVFAGGAARVWWEYYKAYNQSFRWSFDYVQWRSEAEGRWR